MLHQKTHRLPLSVRPKSDSWNRYTDIMNVVQWNKLPVLQRVVAYTRAASRVPENQLTPTSRMARQLAASRARRCPFVQGDLDQAHQEYDDAAVKIAQLKCVQWLQRNTKEHSVSDTTVSRIMLLQTLVKSAQTSGVQLSRHFSIADGRGPLIQELQRIRMVENAQKRPHLPPLAGSQSSQQHAVHSGTTTPTV